MSKANWAAAICGAVVVAGLVGLFVAGLNKVPTCYTIHYCAEYDRAAATGIFQACVGDAPDDENDYRVRECLERAVQLTCTKTGTVKSEKPPILSPERIDPDGIQRVDQGACAGL